MRWNEMRWDGELTGVISGGKGMSVRPSVCAFYLTLSVAKIVYFQWRMRECAWRWQGEACLVPLYLLEVKNRLAFDRGRLPEHNCLEQRGLWGRFWWTTLPQINTTGRRTFWTPFLNRDAQCLSPSRSATQYILTWFCHFVNIEWKRLSMVSLVYLKNLSENVR